MYGPCAENHQFRCKGMYTGRRKRDHISDAVRSLGWLPARKLAVYHLLCLLKRVLQNGEPSVLRGMFMQQGQVRVRSTRRDADLLLPRIWTESGRRRFSYRAASEFNALPEFLRDSSLSVFKAKVRCRLQSS